MKRMLDHALVYLKRGWSVIPIRPESKLPLIQWAEYQNRLPTEAEVRKWWSHTPGANIGVITGQISGIVVVDVDVHHGGDPKPIFEQTPTELVQRTPSGGFHLIYRYPEGTALVQSCTAIRNGVDIRGDGGYIVVAPSIGANKRSYAWTMEGTAGEMPSWAAEKSTPTTDETTPSSDRWVSEILSGVDEGNRNNAAAKVAGYLASKAIPIDIAVSLLSDWNKANAPPMNTKELETTITSVYRKEARSGKRRLESARVRVERRIREWMTPVDVTLRRAADYELVWDVRDWLPRSTVGLVVSPPGAYKTWCMLDLAVSIATGKPFLGHLPILNTGPVFVFQQEDSRYSLMDRLATILQARFAAGVTEMDDGWEVMTPPSGIPIWVHEHRQLQFDREQSAERFIKEVEKIRPTLVIIDPLYMAAGQDSSFMAETVQNLKLLKDLRDSYGTSFMIVHHTKKNVGTTPGRMDAWGSQFLNAFLETGWQIRPVFVEKSDQFSTKAIRLERHFKDADSEHTPLYLQFGIDTEGYRVDLLEDVQEIKHKSVSDRELLRQFEMPNTISQAARDSGLDKSTVSRRVAKWREDGTIQETKRGKHTRYVLVQPLDDGDLFSGD